MKAWQFAKKYPEIHKGIILKISKANGFQPSEVHKYRKALRGLPEDKKVLAASGFSDNEELACIVTWLETAQGHDFWSELDSRLRKSQ